MKESLKITPLFKSHVISCAEQNVNDDTHMTFSCKKYFVQCDSIGYDKDAVCDLFGNALENAEEQEERALLGEIIARAAKDGMSEVIVLNAPEIKKILQKQVPYKPDTTKLIVGVGRCKCGVEFLDKDTNYCGNCGQLLDWGENK